MPHIIVEHSSNISRKLVTQTLPEIQKITESIKGGNFALEACKARAISFDEYYVGSKNQEKSAFFHVTVKILAGRSVAIKTELSQNIAKYVMEFLKLQNIAKERCDVSVDIVDMEKETYQKITL